MEAVELAKTDLVIANRVMARIGAVDAYGHVSVRHPEDPAKYLISRSISPEFVCKEDVLELPLDGEAADGARRRTYRECFMHSEIYKARADVMAVVHGHAKEILPFSVSNIPLRPVFFGTNECGSEIPVWDIRDEFGDTDLLIRDEPRGEAAARALGVRRAMLLRGHGMICAGRSVMHLVRIARSLLTNADMYMAALRLGPVTEMSPGEIAARDSSVSDDEAPATLRGWDYEAKMAGCEDLALERAELWSKLRAPQAG